MRYTKLGRAGVEVSRVCLGCMNFGPVADESTSFAIMSDALERGVNFFDTANVYGGRGKTEELMGRWFAEDGRRRDEIVLATKVYGRMGEGVNDEGLSAYTIRKACEDSLRRLQTDRIDLYQMHHVDRSVRWEEIFEAMERLRDEGKILYYGSSNFAAWNITEAVVEAKHRGALGLVTEQSLYNLTKRDIELEVAPACKRFGVGILPWSPLGGGVLAGTSEKGDRRSRPEAKKNAERHADRIAKYEALCEELGEPPAKVALAWTLANPAVTAPIIGPRTLEQLESGVAAVDLELSQETLDKLDEIFPGPGNQAPEAYAW